MFDERVRMYEQQQAANASALRRGMAKGIEQGIEKGKRAFASLVQEGLLTKEQASEKLGIPVSELEKYL